MDHIIWSYELQISSNQSNEASNYQYHLIGFFNRLYKLAHFLNYELNKFFSFFHVHFYLCFRRSRRTTCECGGTDTSSGTPRVELPRTANFSYIYYVPSPPLPTQNFSKSDQLSMHLKSLVAFFVNN
jgi:hypothetical protein